jgi:phenylalanyl-tRNA synthetase beta chain
MRPISNVVDITNYVMLALGNPLHAFDHSKLAGGKIVVRRARPGERLRTLDGIERELEPYDLMIADGERCVALAGIMGGEETEIGEDTTEILLEAANFEPYTIFRTSERLRLRTEGSNRWEKGVDPYVAEQAAKLATQLIVELAGAEWAGHADVHPELPVPPTVRFRPERADAVVGIETPPDQQHAILRRLGFGVDGEKVAVPTWRARDVTREIDVVEEIARFRLDEVPARLPTRQAMFGRLSKHQRIRRRIEEVLVGFGYSEAYTWSLLPEGSATGPSHCRAFSGEQAVLHVADRGPACLRLAQRPRGQRGDRARAAHVYLPSANAFRGRWRVGGIAEGGFVRERHCRRALRSARDGTELPTGGRPAFARSGRAHRRRLGRLPA